jgi:hypothetical protein
MFFTYLIAGPFKDHVTTPPHDQRSRRGVILNYIFNFVKNLTSIEKLILYYFKIIFMIM